MNRIQALVVEEQHARFVERIGAGVTQVRGPVGRRGSLAAILVVPPPSGG